jgi:cysteine desulfurase/selenocysteine lyase
VPMAGGLVNPAAEVGRLCRAAGVPYVLDACQSVGQLPVDVDALGCDILVGTGRKFLRGPRGTGFAYLNGHRLEQARQIESREAGMAARLGLGRAVEYALELGIEPIRERIRVLAGVLRAQLAGLSGVEIHDQGEAGSGIVTFSVQGSTAQQIKALLAESRINVSTVALPPPTPDAALRPAPADPPTAVRASVHCYNTDSEIARLVSALR